MMRMPLIHNFVNEIDCESSLKFNEENKTAHQMQIMRKKIVFGGEIK